MHNVLDDGTCVSFIGGCWDEDAMNFGQTINSDGQEGPEYPDGCPFPDDCEGSGFGDGVSGWLRFAFVRPVDELEVAIARIEKWWNANS